MRLLALAAACCLASTASAQEGATTPRDEPATWKELVAGQSKLQFYGFIRLDAIFDSARPNSVQSPLYVLSEDPALGAAGQRNFTMHPRLTRFGFNLQGPEAGWLDGAAPSGTLELDFQNGGLESRQIIRIRHAYFKLAWAKLSLLAGQTWDLDLAPHAHRQ